MAHFYVALIHHPVYDRNSDIVTTALTNIDVHDIARSCRTYGVRRFYVVTPVDEHRGLARRVIRHWQVGYGAQHNPTRREALDLVRLEKTLDGVEIDIERETGSLPTLIATSAKPQAQSLAPEQLRTEFESAGVSPYLLLLGTGWGLSEEILGRAHRRMGAIRGPSSYNHLSVRAAAAVLLDRLFGNR